jgi:hypothetical protein
MTSTPMNFSALPYIIMLSRQGIVTALHSGNLVIVKAFITQTLSKS